MVIIKSSLSEIEMFRVKKFSGGILSLRDHNAQISVIYVMMKILNKPTELSMSSTKVIVS
ncbi:hypothetical protein [Candidatus Enterovibrio altilux]|uniref:hypothetical protein n=1 Tax=Candidatus Enterovibrio altilux TaxID=1927128 RepID=UPI0012381399|nr:hypothetical protein [Candidatus Enterovibrio luxaltus]